MMRYFPQTWASDCSDHYERISIQQGLSYGYPQSCYTSHVSHHSNHQMLRDTPYYNKFPVCAMGVLGYELMLNELTPIQKKSIKNQIAFYKEHKKLLQFGNFYRIKDKEFEGDCASWQVISEDKSESIMPVNHMVYDQYCTLIDKDNHEIMDDDINGEILIFGDSIAKGYHNLPELTNKKFITFNGKPAFKTGDLAYKKNGYTELGYMQMIKDRKF